MWTALKKDRVWWVYLGFLAALNVPHAWPWLGAQVPRLLPAIDPLAVTGLLAVLLYGWRQIEDRDERLFWGLTFGAYSCWWLAEVIFAVLPPLHGGVGFQLFIDGLYLWVFMLSLAAVEGRPDLGGGSGSSRPIRPRIELAGTVITLVFLAFYFILIPSRLDPEHYGTRINSSMLYAALDVLVGIRYLQLSWQTRRPRWRTFYGLIGLTLIVWFLLDTANAMARAGWFELPALSPWRLLWISPLVMMAAAACLRRHRFEEPGRDGEESDGAIGLFRAGSPIVVMALLLPLMHNALTAFGLLLPGFQPARNWLVVAALVCLGTLMLIEHASEKARSRRERRSAARDLRHSDARFKNLAEASFEGVVVHDGKTILDANEQLAQMFGFPLEEIIGTEVGAQVVRADRERVQERLGRPPDDEPIEFSGYRSDRTQFFIEARSRELPSLGSGMRVAVLRDITEQRRLEDELRQAQKMDAVGRLAGGIAHDFNNLLTVILGTCDVASKTSFDSDVDQIRLAAKRAAGMTQQLLAFSRQQRLEIEALDLNAVVRETQPMLRRLLPEHIELHVELQADLAQVRADRSQLSQVILNLAINGRDAMPAGGRLVITSKTSVNGSSSVRVDEDGRCVSLEVTDQGSGIDPEDQGKIFEPFFTTKERGRGTGLGLATVHGIVRQLGGVIDVSSELGCGTTFRVDLPICDIEATAASTTCPEPGPAGELRGTGTILVIEDQVEICQLIEHFLARAGFEVICAHNGAEAFELARDMRRPADLLIVDVVLPHVGGPEVAARLREKWPKVKTLFMSGYSEGPWIEAIRDRPLLDKPFDRQQLFAKMRQVLGDAKA